MNNYPGECISSLPLRSGVERSVEEWFFRSFGAGGALSELVGLTDGNHAA